MRSERREVRGEVLLSTTYFGPVQWYQKLHRYDHVWLERMENFQKQTYRNRCIIASPNGALALTIPVTHDEGKTLMRDIRISDHGNWRRLHWNALQTAYGESHFFEYYADELHPFFEKRWEYLYDFNLEITLLLCQWLDIQPDIHHTETYARPEETAMDDFRSAIRPKHSEEDPDFSPKEYYQVYRSSYGFIPNLSILDLLFNEGNESVFFL